VRKRPRLFKELTRKTSYAVEPWNEEKEKVCAGIAGGLAGVGRMQSNKCSRHTKRAMRRDGQNVSRPEHCVT